MTYNILANFLAKPDFYPYVERSHLAWDHRRSLLLQEIGRVRPAILCLQELQGAGGDNWHNHAATLESELGGLLGYNTIYARKTGSGFRANLGNALMFRSDVFEECGQMILELRPAIGARCKSRAQQFYFGGPQVAIFARLRHRATGAQLVAATTHITCAFTEPPKQLAQVQECLMQLQGFAAGLPVIFCGDFNSVPGSAVHDLITRGSLSKLHPDAVVPEEAGFSLP